MTKKRDIEVKKLNNIKYDITLSLVYL